MNHQIRFLQIAVLIIPLAMLNLTFNVFSLWKFSIFFLIVAWMGSLLLFEVTRTGVWHHASSPLDKPFALFAIAVAASTAFSVYPLISIRGNYEWMLGAAFFIPLWLFFRMSLRAVASQEGRFSTIRAIAISTLIVAMYAVFQVFGLDFIEWSSQGSFDTLRSSSTMGNPLILGIYLAMLTPLLVAVNLQRSDKAAKWLSYITLPLMQAALLFTFSRGALFAELVGLTVLLALYLKTVKLPVKQVLKPLILLFAGAVFFLAVANYHIPVQKATTVQGQLLSNSVASQQSQAIRFEFAKDGLEMLSDRPLLGWGLGTFGYVQPSYRTSEQVQAEGSIHYPVSSHNELLDIAVSLGFVGLLAFIFLNVLFVMCCLRSLRKDKSQIGDTNRILVAASIAAVAAMLADMFVTFSGIAVYVVYVVIVGVGLSAAGYVQPHTQIFRIKRSAGILKLATVVLGILLTMASLLPIIADMFYRQGYILQRTDAIKGSELIEKAEKTDPAQPLYKIESAYSFVKLAFDPKDPDLENEAVKFGVTELSNLGETYPYERDIYIKLAHVYSDSGKAKQAMHWLEMLQKYDPDGVEANYISGKLAEMDGNTASAISHYLRVLKLHPQNAPAMRRLAVINITTGNNAAARRFLQILLEIEPGDQEAARQLKILSSDGSN